MAYSEKQTKTFSIKKEKIESLLKKIKSIEEELEDIIEVEHE